MRKTVLAAVVLVVSLAVNVRGQDDAQAAINAAAQALGVASLTTLQYSGTGTINTFGQSWKYDVGWPEFKLNSYTVLIDYKTPAMQVDLTRDNPEGKPLQGGGYPLLVPDRAIQLVSGKLAWNLNGQNPTPVLGRATERMLEIWSTPQGAIKAAQAAGASVKASVQKNSQGDVTGTVLTFPVANTNFSVTLTKDNLVSRVEYTTDTAMLGDTATKVLYTGYQDFGGVKFPAKIVRVQGGVPSVQIDSYQTLTLTVTKVMANALVSISVPPSIEQAASRPAAVAPTVDKVVDGVYRLSGQGPNSVGIEFNDYLVLVEAPVNDAVTMARFDALRKTVPNKPIKYVVSTHHHFDHSGGIRAAVAEDATLIVPGSSRVFYDRALMAPHTLNPDLLAKSPKKPSIEEVGTAFGTERDMLELTDSKRTLRIYRVIGSQEADAMLVAYLPAEKILVEADMYTPETPGHDQPAASPDRNLPLILTPESLVLYNNIKRLNLDVETIVPLHGQPTKMAELSKTVGAN